MKGARAGQRKIYPFCFCKVSTAFATDERRAGSYSVVYLLVQLFLDWTELLKSGLRELEAVD